MTFLFEFTSFLAVCAFTVIGAQVESECSGLKDGNSTKSEEPTISYNHIARVSDWSVFSENEPKNCWVMTTPYKTIFEPDNSTEDLCRGTVNLSVAFWPEKSIHEQLSFSSGYTFDHTVDVKFNMNHKNYRLLTKLGGKHAWPKNAAEDMRIVSAMKRARHLTIIAKAKNGQSIKDTFSLSGFASAIEIAARTCGSEYLGS